jgi:Skp family chaperone for outer membrane proteins
MTIKVVNFEILSRHYKNYQDGITKISDTKKEFIERLDPFKKEMEIIINKANNGEKLTEEQEAKFQDFQNKAVEIDEEFKFTMRKMNDELSKVIYSDLSNFIDEWTKINTEVDLVIGSTEVVFLKEEHDVTEQVLEIIKEKGLHV